MFHQNPIGIVESAQWVVAASDMVTRNDTTPLSLSMEDVPWRWALLFFLTNLHIYSAHLFGTDSVQCEELNGERENQFRGSVEGTIFST